MNLYLVRHGKTDWNKQGLIQGRSDIPLNDEGRLELKDTANELNDIKFDICFCSPLSRAKESAEIIIDNACPIVIDERLIERCCGEFEGTKIDKTVINNSWILNYDNYTNGEETVEDTFKRTKEFLDYLKNTDYENVLVVSHGGTIKAINYNLVGYDNNTDFSKFYLKNGKYMKYKI